MHAKSPGTPIRISVTAKDVKYGPVMNWLNPLNIPQTKRKQSTLAPLNKTKISISSPGR